MQQPFNEPIPAPANPPIPLKDLAEILIRHYGFHDGFYEIGIQFNIAVGSVGPDATSVAPGAVLAVAGVGLSRCPATSPMAVDASVVNPLGTRPVKKKIRNKAAV